MGQGLNQDSKNNYSDLKKDIDGKLSHKDIKFKLKGKIELGLNDYKKLKPIYIFKNVDFIGWNHFFGDYVKVYFIIENKYTTYCVASKNYLKLNIENIKHKEFTHIEYRGIEHNSYGKEYPSTFIFLTIPLADK